MTHQPKTTDNVELTAEQLEEAAGGDGNTWTGTLTLASDTAIGLPAVQRSIIAI